uniref:2-oxoadipate dioxygenase/decarboxylase n=1 Tax=Grammatophora oceanica TaxID=210454 RepID=A0A7S1UZW0_9STRA|mmetsp:Transcript_28755/g.42319  ORF Transcript_28755/g.42319 Transcript_28755/m.42319 type:complete len:395 (+) Transcript_28755:122-1306(+)|eukprot:CAMPEP_0194030382 /NCGR_PEP_ID=MMETSP0009_2-20130614/3892_1 /TAXON_ID=210454 /ORGANISM="Grammatophora oceanica, Strain CCMP 410" /LENGTH=394 /DNA_ID=CAMNT_0038670321 /DNA_START=73 /DNA_END=1257 /DNA_ORIENTATION=-
MKSTLIKLVAVLMLAVGLPEGVVSSTYSASDPSTTMQQQPSCSESSSSSPHLPLVDKEDPRQVFLGRLLDRLWIQYRSRQPWVQLYEEVMMMMATDDDDENNEKPTTRNFFRNDHVAFRTIATSSSSSSSGINAIGRLLEALGYHASTTYNFPKKHLGAIHYEHLTNPLLPKMFVSELRLWELLEDDGVARDIVQRVLMSSSRKNKVLTDDLLVKLYTLGKKKKDWTTHDDDEDDDDDEEALLELLSQYLEQPLWDPPTREDLEKVHAVSQYGAWVLVHGYRPNHFTALVEDIDTTVELMQKRGIPMKASGIEGAKGSKLRQTATEASQMNIVLAADNDDDGSTTTTIPWSYAYFEIAERNNIIIDGVKQRYEGFLGAQATELFEMTQQQQRQE